MEENIMNNVTDEIVEGISTTGGFGLKTVVIATGVALTTGFVAGSMLSPKVAGLLSHDEDDEEEKPKRRKRSKGETVIDVEAEEVDDEE